MRSEDFRQRLSQNPDNPLLQFSLGEALYAEGDFAGAREPLQSALKSRPDWMMVHILIGKANLELGDSTAARPHLEEALRLARTQDHEGPEAEVTELLQGLA